MKSFSLILNLTSRVNMQIRHGGNIPIILLEDLVGRGSKGEVIQVKRGFARNLLVPRKIAVYATAENKLKYVAARENRPDPSYQK